MTVRQAPLRVVTLPPTVTARAAEEFAKQARTRGASILEVRTDLHAPDAIHPEQLNQQLDLLVSERGRPVPEAWSSAARLVDLALEDLRGAPPDKALVSHHAPAPLTPAEAERLWSGLPRGTRVKHVEPLERADRVAQLLETQRRLQARFGVERVTVLATGPLALPVRALLARQNALDYLALETGWAAAPGQRLLADAVREHRAGDASGPRLGILGTSIAHSRSPRIHRQPFDRIDLPEDAPVEQLVDALGEHYAGFAITSPFKKRLARHAGSELEAVNTLVRRGSHWEAFNTDLEGARAVLDRMGSRTLFALGDGGASAALKAAARELGVALTVLRREECGQGVRGAAGVWTWPDRIAPPDSLRFEGARVAVIAYGAPGRVVARAISARGGVPVMLGAAWFVAQARRQRALWETAS